MSTNERPIAILFHDESAFQAHDAWVLDSQHQLRKKGVGIHRSDFISVVCEACGSGIMEVQYQARAAYIEAHNTILTCGKCFLDSSRISLASPVSSVHIAFPRKMLRRYNVNRRPSFPQRRYSFPPIFTHLTHPHHV